MIKKLALVGTTSSGKSTIANLLAGYYILPSSVQETSTSVLDIVLLNYRKEFYIKGGNFYVVACDKKNIFLDRTCSNYKDIRNLLQKIMVQYNRTFFLRLDFYNKRKEKLFNNNYIITDYPGFRHKKDKACVNIIYQKMHKDSHILFIFNAEETDLTKEKILLRYIFLIMWKKGMDWSSISFILNRKDAFLRDSCPKSALKKTLDQRKRLIREAVYERYKVKCKPHITCISADGMLTAELLCWEKNNLSEKDFKILNKKIKHWTSALIPEDLIENLPRATKNWKTRDWSKAFKVINNISGSDAFLKHLKERVFY